MSVWLSALAPALDGWWLLGAGVLLGSVGRSLRGNRHDVTDPKSADAAVNAELHRLAKGLSHDLAGPLRSLSVALELVEEDLEAGDVDDAGDTLALVRTQAAQLARMTADLVTYCRSAWHPMSQQEVSLGALVGRVVAEQSDPDGPRTRAEVAGVRVNLEAQAFSTVLGAILENARLHHGGGAEGLVRITAQVNAQDGRDWLSVHVDDDGQGVPEEMHDAVFAVFRRSTSTADGSGVGLALAQTLTWRAGGFIELQESDMGGACVHIRWPLATSHLLENAE